MPVFCPSCRNIVEDHLTECPYCGQPLQNDRAGEVTQKGYQDPYFQTYTEQQMPAVEEQYRHKRKMKRIIRFGMLAEVIILVILGVVLFCTRNGSEETEGKASASEASEQESAETPAEESAAAVPELEISIEEATEVGLPTADDPAVEQTTPEPEVPETATAEPAELDVTGGIYTVGENDMGNSCQNVSEGGVALEYNGALYYSNYYDGGKLYCRNADGSTVKLTDFCCYYLNVWDGLIWFAGNENANRALYAICPDGSNLTTFLEGGVYEPKFVDGWIYYNDTTDAYNLYRIRTDGTGRQRVVGTQAYFCCYIGDTIYYLDYSNGRKGYAVSTDGGTPRQWNSQSIDSMDTWDGRIYYTLSDKSGIYCWDPEKQTHTCISELDATCINVTDGTIYFSNTDTTAAAQGELCSMNLQGKAFSVLVKTKARFINIWNGTAYYCDMNAGSTCFYAVSTSGGTPAKLN